MDYQIYQTERNFSNFKSLVDDGERYIYSTDDYLYYEQYGRYARYDMKSGELTALFEMDNVLPIDKNKFLYTKYDEEGLFIYDEVSATSIKIISDEISDYSYDMQDSLVFIQQLNMIIFRLLIWPEINYHNLIYLVLGKFM